VNFTDRTGREPRDLTQWLYNEMVWNAQNDPSVKQMQILNALSSLCADSDITQILDKVAAFAIFYGQVHNGARWDFKDEIGIKIGPGITLCTTSGCHTDMEYSIPGNIFFGYIGMASGFSASELKFGAGFAEKNDPAHNSNSDEYVGPYHGITDKSSADPVEWNWGDEPSDNVAVTLGIRMWIQHRERLTLSQFKDMLGSVIAQLDHLSPRRQPVGPAVALSWPYHVGYFNNTGNVYNITTEAQ